MLQFHDIRPCINKASSIVENAGVFRENRTGSFLIHGLDQISRTGLARRIDAVEQANILFGIGGHR